MKIKLKVDWLTLTGKSSWSFYGASGPSYVPARECAERLLDICTDGDAAVKVDRPAPHYKYGFKDVHSGLHVSIGADLQQQGWMIRASGMTLNTPARQARLLMLAGTHGWNCSRLDFAVDILDSEFKPADIWTAWKMAHQENMQKSVTLIESPSGDTFYLGSRSSEKMVRVYDKGAEQGVALRWLRVEMEFKGEAATRAADAAQYNVSNLVAPLQHFMDVVGHPMLDAIWLVSPSDAADGYWPLRETPPRDRWFYTDVLSALRKWAADDVDEALGFLLKAHDEVVVAAEIARRREHETALL